MVCWLSHLERPNSVQLLWVQIPLRASFYIYFREPVSGEHDIFQLIPLHSLDSVLKTSIK